MTQEEKAKAYDKSYKTAENIHRFSSDPAEIKRMEEIFPALKESEDERIRKEIIAILQYKYEKYPKDPKYGNAPRWIAWLEKQGQNPQGKSALEAAQEEKVDNQNCLKPEPKFKVGQTIKKEGFNLGFTIVKIEDGFYYNNTGDHFPFTDQDNWELVDQEPAWSEKEEQTFIKSVEALEDFGKFELADWLKEHKNQFLKPQDRWKPSGEQMYYLKRVQEGIFNLKVLESLYNDLRKLEG